MSRISNREAAILGMLCESPRYGYELEKIIEDRGMRNWTEIGFSSIYYVLKRLEKRALIESKIVGLAGKPSRRVYTVTKEGMKAIKEKIKALLSKNQKLISPFDLGIAYLDLLKSEEILECLNLYLKSTDERLSFLQDSIRRMKESGAPNRVIALFDRPLAHMKTEKLWVEGFMKKIQEKEISPEKGWKYG